jgi:hypothetical protein
MFAIASYRLLFKESLSHFIPRFSDFKWIMEQVNQRRAVPGAIEEKA